MLDAEYITAAEHRARRFQGAWTGTSGTLAADVIRLLKERATMAATIEQLEKDNAALRDAVETRLAGGVVAAEAACCEGGKCHSPAEPADEIDYERGRIPADWILRGERELKERRAPVTAVMPLGMGVVNAQADDLRPGSREFLSVLDELRDLHLRKTLDYGVDEDALSNIRSSADIVNMPAWAGCVLRMMDKMHRLKAYFRRGKVEFDGLSDTFKDIACYAVIAEVLRREDQAP